jgi:hypothetical protein
MKYEIIKDKEDLYVLVINNIVVLISRDLDSITNEIHNDAENRKKNPKRWYDPVKIDTADDKPPIIEQSIPNTSSLGRLFDL